MHPDLNPLLLQPWHGKYPDLAKPTEGRSDDQPRTGNKDAPAGSCGSDMRCWRSIAARCKARGQPRKLRRRRLAARDERHRYPGVGAERGVHTRLGTRRAERQQGFDRRRAALRCRPFAEPAGRLPRAADAACRPATDERRRAGHPRRALEVWLFSAKNGPKQAQQGPYTETVHSITSSARASSDCGTSSPSALAVLRCYGASGDAIGVNR